jgi:cation diffusion facilitator family transporter
MNDKVQQSIERWGWGAICVNILLSLLNLFISIISGSLAVGAEMVHNLVDLTASAVLLVGLKISHRQSKAFPYGLYKVENLVAVVVSALIFFTAYEIVDRALFGSLGNVSVRPWMLLGVILSAVIPLVFSSYQLKFGKESNSPSLIASAREYRTHVFSSGIVLVALVAQLTGVRIDRWAALFVVFFIVKTGWELLRDGMRVLLDASLDSTTLDEVRRIIESDPATAGVKVLTGRNSGRYRFLEAEVEFRLNDLREAHAVSERIEKAIREKVPHVERVLIHYEPAAHTVLRYAFPLATPDGKLSEHFGEAPYFAIVTLRTAYKVIERQELIQNPYCNEPKAKGIRVAEWLVAQKVDRVFVKEYLRGKGPEYVLANAGIQFVTFDENTLDSVVKRITDEHPVGAP